MIVMTVKMPNAHLWQFYQKYVLHKLQWDYYFDKNNKVVYFQNACMQTEIPWFPKTSHQKICCIQTGFKGINSVCVSFNKSMFERG